MGNPKDYLNLSVGRYPTGRIVMELYADTTPKTAENLCALCTDERGMGKSGKPLHYKGSIIHTIPPFSLWAGGDIIKGNGTGLDESIYGFTFKDENFIKKHSHPGILSMANRGPNTNISQFHIIMSDMPNLDSEQVAFGQVVQGFYVLFNIERHVTSGCNGPLVPSMPVVITDCDELPLI